ncbi:putative secreted protein [Phyllobacterium ifriqiyense]|uniref:Secreted protein n=1 Tax=Phyllobacterium ifriqiyense TaxID=314238 RepID=A0ABU0SGC8_9HYPH|nr:putative secreted protein [Phyllobacterium ifriqiyense]
MPIATALAVYFIFWWLTLFTMLPIGLRTQAEENDVTLGTTPSAPHKHRMGRVFLWTTLVSAVIFAIFLRCQSTAWLWRQRPAGIFSAARLNCI